MSRNCSQPGRGLRICTPQSESGSYSGLKESPQIHGFISSQPCKLWSPLPPWTHISVSLGFTWAPLPAPQPGNNSGRKLVPSYCLSVSHLPVIIVLLCLLSNMISTTASWLGLVLKSCFRWEGKSSPSFLTLAGSRNLSSCKNSLSRYTFTIWHYYRVVYYYTTGIYYYF